MTDVNVLRWPDRMPETGRLSEGPTAYKFGKLSDPCNDCPQTLHISLFFDGTNNNDDEKNKQWRDSLFHCHTNVARLFGATIQNPKKGMFRYYMPGVGTPFPDLGEEAYSTFGKSVAGGFSARSAWGYTRILNALYDATSGLGEQSLMSDAESGKCALALADGNTLESVFQRQHLTLTQAHQDNKNHGRQHRTIKKAWINVFGFSRGAAGARVFVHKLITEWAPGGKIAGEIDYEVNFLGLFDTVASVGPPDTVRGALDLDGFDGHFAWAKDGGLNVPSQVRRCAHFFSIHEQRMSFPLDTLRKGNGYPAGFPKLLEVAFPGVHSDVGGGYPPGNQGKARGSDDSRKLSQISLHHMYIEALKAGVPLFLVAGPDPMRSSVKADFAISPEVVKAFNDWLAVVKARSISKVEDVMRIGMAQSLAWRALRSRIGTEHYVDRQKFFQEAPEDALTPHQIQPKIDAAAESDPELKRLKEERRKLRIERMEAGRSASPPFDMKQIRQSDAKLQANKIAIERREGGVCAQTAGKDPQTSGRPGEGAGEIVTNDKTDLREAAEEFRLLLGYLHPEQRDRWKVGKRQRPGQDAGAARGIAPVLYDLVVAHEQPGADTKQVYLCSDIVSLHRGRSFVSFNPEDDVLFPPVSAMTSFLKQHTCDAAVDQLLQDSAVVHLFDDYIHDSRAWFRVPSFREYSPGGFGWPRMFFIGDDKRVLYLGLATEDIVRTVNRSPVPTGSELVYRD
ncbi:DUF2235 domain-containing protein [Ralstonia pseudosolanacearum]|uniref:T6SS phospholipase effector Tle1-like catalytic domain-containing protein n=1 Tax=Ralstonia pseudosolanacearum TaxID=1310165 RepID=UPI002005CDAF|nr:DUF2235 domain-containing protein [Ralstonia pseudosolanacearum]MCK4139993.1 DUF2235 domain-containing protein [Ralstonia pseudosolanacearum]